MQPSTEMALILLVGGLVLLAMEMFLPSAGLLFLLSMGCIIGSVVVGFLVGSGTGVIFLLTVLFLAFVLPSVCLGIWRRSPIGRRMFLDFPDRPDESAEPEEDPLLGRVGIAVTPLRPSGTVEIMGRRIDGVTEGVAVQRGQSVRVVGRQGNRVVVRHAPKEDDLATRLLEEWEPEDDPT